MTATPAATDARQVILQKIYLKDASVEVPLAPQIFTRAWQPQLDVQANTAVNALQADVWQVVLTLTVTTKLGDDTAFLVEVQQAGIFGITGFNDAERQAVLAGYCANIIFPFAREAVADLVQRSGFPQLLLQPINFEGLYAEHQARQKAQAGNGDVKH